MTTNVPALLSTDTPMQRVLATVLEELGGIDFIVEWAEEYPGEFMRMVMAANHVPNQAPSATPSGGVHLHVHPSLQAGPLDVVSEQ